MGVRHRRGTMASVDLVARLVDTAVFRGLCGIPGEQLAIAISICIYNTVLYSLLSMMTRYYSYCAHLMFKFAIIAILALLHDLLMCICIYILLILKHRSN